MFQRIFLQIRAVLSRLGLVTTLLAGVALAPVNAGQVDASTSMAPSIHLPPGLTMDDWNEVQSLLPAPIKGLMQQAYIKASNTGDNDFFGDSISLSGDTLAVGAWDERSNATGVDGNQADRSTYGSGAVYIFTRNGETWAQQAYIKASNTEEGDAFGSSVSLSGDTLAVGALDENSNATGVNGNQADNSATAAGAVYVFTRSGTTWTQQAYIKASNTEAYDHFSNSISLSGDTLAVGANGESSSAIGINGDQTDNSASASGSVYIFTRSGTTWSQQAYIKASNTDANDLFGDAISLSGNTLAVGAYGEDSSATGVNGAQADNSTSSSGAVYVFTRSGTVWSQLAYLKASITQSRDYFGRSLSLSGNTLAVGAEGEDSNALGVNGDQSDNSADYSGAVYVFTRSGTAWSQKAYVKSSNTESLDGFGHTVSLSGDTLAVGATGEDSGVNGVNGDQADNSVEVSGAVYLFARRGTTWSQKDYLKASNSGEDDNFSRSLSLSGNTLAVGAAFEDSTATGVNGDQTDNSAENSGAAYVFTTGTLPTASSSSVGVYVPVDTTSFTVRFSVPVADFGGGSGRHDVTNPANYLLVDRGANKRVDTKTCRAGVVADDTRIDIQNVTYDIATQTTTIHLASPLPRGLYRLFVCGTTSIMDMAGNHINGGIDSTYDFGAGLSIRFSASDSSSSVELPATGFAPGHLSVLPDRPEPAYYHASDTHLEIPTIGVYEAVVGVPQGSGWDVSWLGSNIGYLEGTAYPSLPGNSVLAAHVYNADGLPGPFIHLGELKYGDRVIVHTFGQNYRYEVRDVQDWVQASDTRLVTRHEDLPWLTLVTCRGYNAETDSYNWRTIVRAVLINIEP
jgi:LPXTG-site transpeptidase (sortase) family protein